MSIFDDFDCTRSANGRIVTKSREALSPEQLLFNAACRGQTARVSDILSQYSSEIDVNRSINGFNAAQIACKKGHSDILVVLLKSLPAFLQTKTSDGRSLLMIAAFEMQLDILKVLKDNTLSKNESFINEDTSDSRGNSVVHYAAWGGSLDCVRFLVEECHFPFMKKNTDDILPIQFAAAGNFTAVVEYLLNLSNDIEDASVSGLTSLHRACAYGSLDAVKLLVSHLSKQTAAQASIGKSSGLVINEMLSSNGSSALHHATQHGHLDIVKYLCSISDVQFDLTNNFGLTPLHFACIGGYTDIVKHFVLEVTMDQPTREKMLAQKTQQGEDALQLAAASGHHEICRVLHEAHAYDIFSLDHQGQSCVDKTIANGYKELANKLITWSCLDLMQQEYEALLM